MTRLAGSIAFLAAVALLLSPSAAQEKDKKKEKPKRVAVTSEKEAGPDFAVQGEYAGQSGSEGPGVQLIARGDGKFDVNVLKGGLAGAGWDGQTKLTGKAVTEGDRVIVNGKEFSGEIANGTLTLKVGDKTVKLKHIVRQSPTAGLKPPPGAVILFDGSEESLKEWTGGGGKLIEGNMLRVMDGSYQLKANGAKTTVTYTLTVDINLPMIGMFKRKAEKTIIDNALKGLKKRVEG